MSWGEEWGDDPKRRRPRDPDAEFRKKEEERENNQQNRDQERSQAKSDHYWSRTRNVGQDRYQALMPSRPIGVAPIEEAATAARRQLGPAPLGLLVCGPCRSAHHENCLRSFHLNDGGEEVLCECSADAHWIHGGGR